MHNGKKTDVVVQTTKDGLVYVLDRDSGVSLFPVEERPVPTKGLPGEHPGPTQKYPLKPFPFAHQTITDSDLTNISPEAHAYVQKIFNATKKEPANKFLPPDTTGTVLGRLIAVAPNGAATPVDSEGVLYQNSNDAAWLLRMISMQEQKKEMAKLEVGYGLYVANCASCHGADRKGNGHEIPSLLGISQRLKPLDLAAILKNGQGRMPSFQQLPDQQRTAIINFCSTAIAGFG